MRECTIVQRTVAVFYATQHLDSVFTVVEAVWVDDLNEYHKITIKAATDNRLSDESLPLAPWS